MELCRKKSNNSLNMIQRTGSTLKTNTNKKKIATHHWYCIGKFYSTREYQTIQNVSNLSNSIVASFIPPYLVKVLTKMGQSTKTHFYLTYMRNQHNNSFVDYSDAKILINFWKIK